MINKKPTRKLATMKNIMILPVALFGVYSFATPEYHNVPVVTEPLSIYMTPEIIQNEVRGIIVLKEDGKPLGNAYIMCTVTPGNVTSATSGSDGRFVLGNVPGDSYLIVNCRGYISQTIKADIKSEMIIKMVKDPEDPKYILINDILYKIPESEIATIKTTNNIQENDISIFKFDKDSCYASSVEWIKIANLNPRSDPYLNYRVKATPLFIYEGKFVSTDYIYPEDLKSMRLIPKDEAISKYGCKGLNAIFLITLHYGKKIQNKPVGIIKIKQVD